MSVRSRAHRRAVQAGRRRKAAAHDHAVAIAAHAVTRRAIDVVALASAPQGFDRDRWRHTYGLRDIALAAAGRSREGTAATHEDARLQGTGRLTVGPQAAR